MSQLDVEDVESEDEPFVPPPTSWFENESNSSSPWNVNSSDPPCNEAQLLSSFDGESQAQSSHDDARFESSSEAHSAELPPFAARPLHENFMMQHSTSNNFASDQVVGSTHPSPSWKEISSHVLPSAARELLSSSWRRIFYTARLSYSKGRWHRKYSDMGSNARGIYLNGESTFPFSEVQLPPFSSLKWEDRQLVREWRTYLPSDEDTYDPDEDSDFDRARALVPKPFPRPKWKKSDVCFRCHKPFGPTRMRHHCRLCGNSVCHPHSSYSHELPHLGYDPDVPERVCDGCKAILEEQNLAERVAWRLARCRDYNDRNLTPYFEMGLDSASEMALRITKAAISMAKSIPLGAQATVAVETVDVLHKYGFHGIYGIMFRQEFLAAADLLRRALGINKTSWPLSVHELSAAIFYALAQHRAMRGLHPEREEVIHTLRFPNNNSEQQSVASSKVSQWTSSPNPVRTTVPSVIDNLASSALSFHTRHNPVLDETDTYTPNASTLEQLTATFEDLVPDIRKAANPGKESLSTSNSFGFTPVCDPLSEDNLAALIFYAPIALNFIYASKEVDMQLLAAQQGWHLLYAFLEQDTNIAKVKDRPASALFLHRESKIACLSIRGTTTIQDVITDIRQLPVPFPPDKDVSNTQKDKDDEWTKVFQGKGLALCGMAAAAVNLFNEHIESIMHFANLGYRIRIVGHSLGGGVATMIGVLLMRQFECDERISKLLQASGLSEESSSPLQVYAYGTPSCLDAQLAESVNSFVTTVVLHDDVFPRLTPTSCRALLKHLLHIRETWVKQNFNKDIHAVRSRASTVWRPKTRHSFTLVAKPSSSAIKNYCKEQLQYGKKTLLSVRDKVSRKGTNTGEKVSYERKEEANELPSSSDLEGSHVSTTPDDWGERFFVPTTGFSQKLAPSDKEREEKRDDSTIPGSSDPQLLLELLGGGDTNIEGLVIGGDEFFDPTENLEESDSEENSVCTDVFEDAVHASPGFASTSFDSVVGDSWSVEPEKKVSTPDSDSSARDELGPAPVVLDETPLPRMFVPGRVVHIYSHRGVFKATYVPRTLRELRRISLAGNMLSDHTSKAYYESLLEVQTARTAPEKPPKWSAFDEDDTCCCCACRFTWASTSDSAAQEARDKHNCRSCGGLVCDPCAKNRSPIPTIGLVVPVRVCDRCYNDMGGHSVASSSLTSSFLAIDEDEQRSRDDFSSPGRLSTGNDSRSNEAKTDDRPERRREKRSLVVDELATRMCSAAALAPC